jgi:hypothetical protein
MGIGIFKNAPPPIKLKESERFDTGLPSLNTNASPLAIVIMPKVTINEATLPFVMINPLITPIPSPINIPTNKGTISPCVPGWAKLAAATPVNATTEPKDKSIPPDIMTNVTPMAKIPLIEVCRNTITIFCSVKKFGVAIVRIIHINNKAMNIPYFLKYFAIPGEFSIK